MLSEYTQELKRWIERITSYKFWTITIICWPTLHRRITAEGWALVAAKDTLCYIYRATLQGSLVTNKEQSIHITRFSSD